MPDNSSPLRPKLILKDENIVAFKKLNSNEWTKNTFINRNKALKNSTTLKKSKNLKNLFCLKQLTHQPIARLAKGRLKTTALNPEVKNICYSPMLVTADLII